MHQFFEKIWKEEITPIEWKESDQFPLYQLKGDAMSCENFREIKFIAITLKVSEKWLRRDEEKH